MIIHNFKEMAEYDQLMFCSDLYKNNPKKCEEIEAAIHVFNDELEEKYPFLKPKDFEDKNHYHAISLLTSELPYGWIFSFLDDLLEELSLDLIKNDLVDDYVILQVKEKFGELRWYDSGGSEEWDNIILPKYEELSRVTCHSCGKPASWLSTGWILPYCDECKQRDAEKHFKFTELK